MTWSYDSTHDGAAMPLPVEGFKPGRKYRTILGSVAEFQCRYSEPDLSHTIQELRQSSSTTRLVHSRNFFVHYDWINGTAPGYAEHVCDGTSLLPNKSPS
jgi:hypothetical protein